MTRLNLLTLIALCCVLAACGGDQAADRQGQKAVEHAGRPDVVLILIDTFRPDHLGFFGYHQDTAPFLDRLLSRSTVFDRAFSTSSWTAPSTSSLFTGLYPSHHGVTEGFLARKQRAEASPEPETVQLNRLPAQVPTLAELLAAHGYATMGVASNINIGTEIGFDRGFDRFRKLADRPASQLGRQILDWNGEFPDEQPRFFYLHFNDVHEPYVPRDPWYREQENELASLVAAYDSEISYLDREIEALYTQLGWDENTLLVLASDHGEEFEEHGQIGHQFTLYNELMRVLLAFSGADLAIPAQRHDAVNVSLIDALPTILGLLELPAPEGRDGTSLAPLVRRSQAPRLERRLRRRVLFGHRSHHRERIGLPETHLWAAVKGDWKLIEGENNRELYDFAQDREERNNRWDDEPERVRGLKRPLRTLQAKGFAEGETTAVEIDEATREQLRALGYVQ